MATLETTRLQFPSVGDALYYIITKTEFCGLTYLGAQDFGENRPMLGDLYVWPDDMHADAEAVRVTSHWEWVPTDTQEGSLLLHVWRT